MTGLVEHLGNNPVATAPGSDFVYPSAAIDGLRNDDTIAGAKQCQTQSHRVGLYSEILNLQPVLS